MQAHKTAVAPKCHNTKNRRAFINASALGQPFSNRPNVPQRLGRALFAFEVFMLAGTIAVLAAAAKFIFQF